MDEAFQVHDRQLRPASKAAGLRAEGRKRYQQVLIELVEFASLKAKDARAGATSDDPAKATANAAAKRKEEQAARAKRLADEQAAKEQEREELKTKMEAVRSGSLPCHRTSPCLSPSPPRPSARRRFSLISSPPCIPSASQDRKAAQDFRETTIENEKEKVKIARSLQTQMESIASDIRGRTIRPAVSRRTTRTSHASTWPPRFLARIALHASRPPSPPF